MREGELDVGDVLDGKFRLDALLGEGAMGRVFDAQHLFMNRRVAVKLLRGEALRATSALQRFQQEALAASRIEHPHIVAVLDFGIDRDTQAPYVVQEFLDGMTLQEHLATAPGGRLPAREAVALAAPVMSALEAAHRKGIVHRDIKPGNIFLVREASGRAVPKIIDFGVAKALTPLMEDAARTRDGQAIGTPLYMAREQAEGVVEVDARADVWAVGVVLFEMLTGRRPYEGRTATIILGQVLSKEPPSVRSLAPELDVALARVVDGALQTDRERRHPSMQAFLEALLACADADGPELDALRGGGGATGEARVSRVSGAAAAPARRSVEPSTSAREGASATLLPTTTQSEGGPRARRSRWGVVLGVGALAAGLIGAALSAGRSEPPARPPVQTARPPLAVRTVEVPARPDATALVAADVTDDGTSSAAAVAPRPSPRVRGPARPAAAPRRPRVILSLDVFTVEDDPP